ncbi:hypothetical protein JCM11641_002716 [Rhodosporidiobolus odoratus]
MAATFNVESLRPAITSLLQGQDRASVSAKRIRKALAVQYPTLDIKRYKEQIDELIIEIYTASAPPPDEKATSDDDEEEEDQKPSLSPPPKPVKPKLPSFKKTKQASPDGIPDTSPSYPLAARGLGDTDADYARRLQEAYNNPSRETRNGGVSTSKVAKRGKKSKKSARTCDSDAEVVDSDDEEGGGRPKKKKAKKEKDPTKDTAAYRIANSKGFNQLWVVSPEMAAVTGHQVLSRPGCTKLLWRYAKRNGLKNPNNGNEIMTDDLFKGIVGDIKTIHSFTLAKHISKHLIAKWNEDEHGDIVLDYSDFEENK